MHLIESAIQREEQMSVYLEMLSVIVRPVETNKGTYGINFFFCPF